jgi:hypothetical protein
MPNPIVHFEICVKDAKKSVEFYSHLFDWKIKMDEKMNYYLIETGGVGGGIFQTDGKDADDRISDGIPQSRPQQDGRGSAGGKSKGVGVKIELEQHHRHEDEVRGGVAKAVASLFPEGQLLRV